MTKAEFFDKIDTIRESVKHLGVTCDDTCEWQEECNKTIKLLDEFREEANQLLEDEFDAGYELGLNRQEE